MRNKPETLVLPQGPYRPLVNIIETGPYITYSLRLNSIIDNYFKLIINTYQNDFKKCNKTRLCTK